LEYIEAQPAPKSIDSIPHEDWVSSISLCDGYFKIIKLSFAITGCYDGKIRFINSKGKIISDTQLKKPVKSIDSFLNDKEISFLTGTFEENSRFFKFNKENNKITSQYVLKGHLSSIESVCFSPGGNMVNKYIK
jgi:WD40 repeat protein